jgi:hypothetical protein
MLKLLRKLAVEHCPTCNEIIQSQHSSICYTRACPHGHYTEETYSHLGVRIVYKK